MTDVDLAALWALHATASQSTFPWDAGKALCAIRDALPALLARLAAVARERDQARLERDNIDRDYREHTETLAARWENAKARIIELKNEDRRKTAADEACAQAAEAAIDHLTQERDAAQAEARSENERFTQWRQLHAPLCEKAEGARLEVECQNWEARADTLAAEVARLQARIAALERYGRHDGECGLVSMESIIRVCTCGLDAALDAGTEA